MIVTHHLKIDWARPEPGQQIPVVQGDYLSRRLSCTLYENGKRWFVPADVIPALRYGKPDGTGGIYNTLPNGEAAWSIRENRVELVLAPQMISVPGPVRCQLVLMQEQRELASFAFGLLVQRDPSWQMEASKDYIHWQGTFLPQVVGASAGQYLQITQVDGQGHAIALRPVDAPTATTPATPGISQWAKQNSIPRTILPYSGYILASTTAQEAAAPATGNLVQLYKKWDALAAQYPNQVQMQVLGKDASGQYDIRCYTITSRSDSYKWTVSRPQKNLKILWLSGIHGHESTVFVDDLKFFTELLKQDNEVTARLMDNCTFKVVPVISPWGYNAGSRTNSNGVNLNRNFDADWAQAEAGTNNYSGSSAMSEAETQVIADFLEENQDCFLAINRHSSSGFGPSSVLGFLTSQLEVDRKLAFNAVKFMSNQIKRSNLFPYLRVLGTTDQGLSAVTWEVGAVGKTGKNISNNYQMRMAGALWLPKGTVITSHSGYSFNVAEYASYTSDEAFTLRAYRTVGTDPYTTEADSYVRISFGEGNTKYADAQASVRTAHIATLSAVSADFNSDVEQRCLHTVESSNVAGTLDKYFNRLGIHGFLYEASPVNLVGEDSYASDWGREVWQRLNVSNIANLLYALMLQNEYIEA